ncbi:RHS repeat-associated core domain-containing protein [Pseudomonas sp. GM60]|uniref:RHS repeat-associated core domain-containing protein n=1 Tax=Pseudomonas sp. GM60 TaxID=1144334 RepID=UPI000270A60A|nr:RHS repeat-associated core domain-containing protein [Pseudomonas sp. GM60]EJM81217.1 RHS repeat-associated core domain protein-containing protein [Pseudomonas sp. GM60]
MIGKLDRFFIHYKYDALDRMTSHRQPARCERQRFYCENRLTTEIQGEEHQSGVQHGDQLLAQQQQKEGRFESTLLAADLQRSVLYTLDTKNPRSSAYAPYGHHSFGSGLPGFNGQLPDPVTGHYLLGNGYRAFNPILMRFNSPDSFSPFGVGGLNVYAYCLGDPINRSDPTGHLASSLSQFLKKAPAVVASYELGIKLKPVSNVTRLSEGVFTFEDVYKGGSRLTFDAHGFPGGVKGDFTGLDLLKLAKRNGVDVSKFESIRIAACHSADIEKNSFGIEDISFAESINRLAKRPVKAYSGRIQTINTGKVFENLKIGEVYEGFYYFGIAKKDSSLKRYGVQYRPVVFDKIKRPVRRVGA